jgi:hypothetical protein
MVRKACIVALIRIGLPLDQAANLSLQKAILGSGEVDIRKVCKIAAQFKSKLILELIYSLLDESIDLSKFLSMAVILFDQHFSPANRIKLDKIEGQLSSAIDKEDFYYERTVGDDYLSVTGGVNLYRIDLMKSRTVSRNKYEPFIFRNGQKANTIDDLIKICAQSPTDGAFHLINRHFESWLLHMGRNDLARNARNACKYSKDGEAALKLFLDKIQ